MFLNMKLKFIVTLGILFFIESAVIADTRMERRFPQKRSAIQSSTYNFNDIKHSSYNINLYGEAIKELKAQINQNPANYALTANLVDLYLKTGEYEKSFEELAFLNELKKQDRLNENTKNILNNIYKSKKTTLQYTNNKALLYSNLAMLALVTDNSVDSKKYIIQATNSGSNEEILTKALKQVHSNNQDINETINECNKIINKNPNAISARKLKAELFEQNNDILSAIKEYTMIIALEPKDNNSKYKLYKLLETQTNNLKEIANIMYTRRPIKIETAYYDLANILLQNNELNAAKFYAEYLAKSTDNKAQGYSLLSEIYRKQGNLQDSYKALDEVKNNLNNNEDVKNYNIQKAKLSNNPIAEAENMIKEELYQQAIDILTTADQNNLDVLLLSSFANYQLGNKKEAFLQNNKAMTLYPNEIKVYSQSAYIYILEKDFETAKKHLDEALKIAPNNTDIQQAYQYLYKEEANSYIDKIQKAYEMQNYKEAERLADEALKISNEVSEINFFKGHLLTIQNKYAESTAYFYKCLELDENYHSAYFYLGMVFDNLSEQENALINYKKYIEVVPNDSYEEQEKINYAKTRIEKLEQHN